MSSKRNNQLAILLLLLLGISAVMLFFILGGPSKRRPCDPGERISESCECTKPRRDVNGMCIDGSNTPVGGGTRRQTCETDSDCPPNHDCVDKVCFEVKARLPVCSRDEELGNPKKCECRAPLLEKEGRCVQVAGGSQCGEKAMRDACVMVDRSCNGAANKGSCHDKQWTSLVISNEAVDELFKKFSDQTAYLFPTGVPKPGDSTVALREEYQRFLNANWSKFANAKMIIKLGRASPIGDREENQQLAKQRMNVIDQMLLPACENAGTPKSECLNILADRVRSVAMADDRPVTTEEFARIFEPRVGDRVDKNWQAPDDAVARQVDSAIAGARGTKGNQYMNQAVFLIPIPCDCAGASSTQAGGPP